MLPSCRVPFVVGLLSLSSSNVFPESTVVTLVFALATINCVHDASVMRDVYCILTRIATAAIAVAGAGGY